MTQFIDIHTHRNTENSNAIISVEPSLFDPQPLQYYSLGIHPWNTLNIKDKEIEMLQYLSQHKQVVAIGEAGIDRLRGADIEKQTQLLTMHIELSETLRKPLILHVVKAIDIILSLHKLHHPTQQWIIHGFRGNKNTALQLIEKGIELSFGEKFNISALTATPINKLWIESDDSTTTIEKTYNKIAQAKQIDTKILKQSIYNRAQRLFFNH